MPRLVVLGAINVDLVVRTERLPDAGETVVGGRFSRHDGGKGGNQAVAAARALRGSPLEGRVSMLGAVGADELGTGAVDALAREGIDTAGVAALRGEPTGVALIVVDSSGENQIAVAPGANASLAATGVAAAAHALLGRGGVLLVSLEVAGDAAISTMRAARAGGAVVVLNPAPASAVRPEMLEAADVIVPNAGERASLAALAPAGVRAGAEEAATGRIVVETLGAEGARLIDRSGERRIPALRVDAVDTTGAGDCFCGVLAACLLEGMRTKEAVRRAVAAAGLSVAVVGAREGMPLREAIDEAVGDLPAD